MTPELLARVAAVGPYFAVTAGERPDATGFRPLSALYGDRRVLEEYVAEVGRRLGSDQRRVAASTLHIGTAARLWSVALGAAVLTGRVPDLAPGRLLWRTPAAGPMELWLPGPATAPPSGTAAEEPSPAALVDALHDTVMVRNLEPFAAALRRHFTLSPLTLRGNAASALVGAARVLGERAPGAGGDPVALAGALLDREPMAGEGVLDRDPLAYRRGSCCLYYRAPGAGMCGECVLHRRRGGAPVRGVRG
ncbi:(2Fe-2S)-binding protein [Streptomyces sp. C10-9-1]|uniref:(2Fe-2S)-binding protein n=1 Tax=Streptomyces sp. C10-9-1 TaxID=1859285 RepID=UPI0021124961|nr:(2Fe-2S)-binding protein [Streptomyces sp. C10-9-1]MCQ6552047.1 (2Fe-2S)-binding protein [Streptomyces sp. C10-9-1]